jgi:uncharacterized protein
MKLTIDSRADINLIRSHAPGEVRVGDALLRAPVLISATAIIADWPVRSITALDEAQLAPLLALDPQVVIIGMPAPTGWPAAAVRARFGARRIGLEVMEFGAACRTYNVLAQEDRQVVLALLP